MKNLFRKRLSGPDGLDPEAGVATVFIVVFAVVFLVLAGLVVDGGLAINARQKVADDVEQAARAGSQNLDEAALRNINGGTVVIDSARAETAARAFLAKRNYPAGNVHVQAFPDHVQVSATLVQPTALLSLIFIDSFTVQAQGQARPAVGITGEDIP